MADTSGNLKFSVFADSLRYLGKEYYALSLGKQEFLFLQEPFQVKKIQEEIRLMPGINGLIKEVQPDGNFRLLNLVKLTPIKNQLFDSLWIENDMVLVRIPASRKWIFQPGTSEEIQVDSVSKNNGLMSLWTKTGVIFLYPHGQQFVALPASSRVFSPGFQYLLSDTNWIPVQRSGRPFSYKQQGYWWNDSSYLDVENLEVFFQSPSIPRKKIADSIHVCNHRFLLLKIRKKWEVLTAAGVKIKIQTPLACRMIHDSLLAINTKGGWRLVFPNGEQNEINKTISEPVNFQEGLLLAKAGKRFGFIDLQGFIRIACRYDSILPFSEGLAALSLGGQWGFLDKSERLVIQPHFEEVTPFRFGLAAAKRDGLWGLINKNGEEVLPFQYDGLSPETQGGWRIRKSGWTGFANSNGKIVFQPRYFNSIEASRHWHIVVRNQKFGLINPNGQIIVPVDCHSITFESSQNLIIYN